MNNLPPTSGNRPNQNDIADDELQRMEQALSNENNALRMRLVQQQQIENNALRIELLRQQQQQQMSSAPSAGSANQLTNMNDASSTSNFFGPTSSAYVSQQMSNIMPQPFANNNLQGANMNPSAATGLQPFDQALDSHQTNQLSQMNNLSSFLASSMASNVPSSSLQFSNAGPFSNMPPNNGVTPSYFTSNQVNNAKTNHSFGMNGYLPSEQSVQSMSSAPVPSQQQLSFTNAQAMAIPTSLAAAPHLTTTTSEAADPSWNEQYAALRDYKLQHGHCRVPCRYTSDPKLGRWVMRQRRQFSLLMRGLPSALTAERIKKLEEVGFTWSVRPEPASWDSMFEELRAFKAKYGACTVPQRYKENPQLGTWVHTQRCQYKLLREGKKSSMTHEKAAKLESIGFFWDAKAVSSSAGDD